MNMGIWGAAGFTVLFLVLLFYGYNSLALLLLLLLPLLLAVVGIRHMRHKRELAQMREAEVWQTVMVLPEKKDKKPQ